MRFSQDGVDSSAMSYVLQPEISIAADSRFLSTRELQAARMRTPQARCRCPPSAGPHVRRVVEKPSATVSSSISAFFSSLAKSSAGPSSAAKPSSAAAIGRGSRRVLRLQAAVTSQPFAMPALNGWKNQTIIRVRNFHAAPDRPSTGTGGGNGRGDGDRAEQGTSGAGCGDVFETAPVERQNIGKHRFQTNRVMLVPVEWSGAQVLAVSAAVAKQLLLTSVEAVERSDTCSAV
jgi:hypothetical protein